MNRFIGLDIGKKKVGIALSDQTLTLARAYKTITFADLKNELKKLLEQNFNLGLIIGLPLKMDGSKGEAAINILQIGQELNKELNLKVFFEDERLTSWEARELMKEAGYDEKKIKQLEDQISAQLILQSFLNRKNYVS